MEGYTTWYKYQTRAATLILRWKDEYTEFIWDQLLACLHDDSELTIGSRDPISMALLAQGNRREIFLNLADKIGQQPPGHRPPDVARRVGEAQLWALLITKAEPHTTSLDRLIDANERIQHLAVEGILDIPRQMRATERARQSKRGKGNRGKVRADNTGNSMVEMIARIAISPENQELDSRDLWPKLLGLLDDDGLNPIERLENGLGTSLTYDFNDGRKSLSFGRFKNVVSQARTASR